MQNTSEKSFDAGSRDNTLIGVQATTEPQPTVDDSTKDLADTKEHNAEVAETIVDSKAEVNEKSQVSAPSPEEPVKIYSKARKYTLLLIFCFAQFLDIFNLSAVYAAIPTIGRDLNMTANEPVWTVSALQLTFSAFLLVSGRICDVYSAKYAFIVGTGGIGAFSIGTGFVRNKIGFFILRAFNGIASSLTIPAALNLIVKVFPFPEEQSRAIAAFGTVGGVANVMGILVGALFVQFRSWHWVFWFAAIIGFTISISSFFLIPPEHELRKKSGAETALGELDKLKGLDLIGVSILTVALVLFVFAIVSGSSTSGNDATSWGKGKVIAPLVISIVMIAAFFYYETTIPEDQASIPPSLWFRPNFAILVAVALYPYFWGSTNLLLYLNYWQDVFEWTVVGSAARTVPSGVSAIIVAFATAGIQNKFPAKWFILFGFMLDTISGLIFPFAGQRDQYWPRVFPALVIGTGGLMLIYVHTNIAIFRAAPPHMAGTIGAIFNSALQLGAAVGIAITTSIATSIDDKPTVGQDSFKGRADGFWFAVAITILEAICVVIFFKPAATEPPSSGEKDPESLNHTVVNSQTGTQEIA